MFKRIQNKLLISNPLLWNLKIIPFVFIALFIHAVFFSLGYITGTVNFSDDNYYSSSFGLGVIIFFSILVSILMTIVWLVLYSRNNAFKSFYPKTSFSLFKEFLYIALFCILTCTFSLSLLYAKDVRAKNYYSQKEITKKLEILGLASIFVDGTFEESNVGYGQSDGQTITQLRQSFQYRDRTYSLNSLMNKTVESGPYYSMNTDTVLKKRVKNWLYENQKDSVKWAFDEFMKIAKEHHLSSNISSEKWLDLVYDYPEFTNYTVVRRSKDPDYIVYEATALDSTTTAIPAGSVKQPSSTYYVPYRALKDGYSDLLKSYEEPTIDTNFICYYLYLSIGIAISIFSFKATSGRNWLIALVSYGVLLLIIGILAALSGGITFITLQLLLFFGLLIHFFTIIASRRSKGISGITLNLVLWMFSGVLPTIYSLILVIAKLSSGYDDNDGKYINGKYIIEGYPKIEWLENHYLEMLIANIPVIVLFILLFSVQIKKWKGIPED